MKILVVCSGNICRSPMAEAILRKRLSDAGAGGVDVLSAGTLGIEDEPAHAAALAIAAEEGLDLTAHRSRPLTRRMAEEADLILAMEPAHVAALRRLVPDHPRLCLTTDFLPDGDPARASGEIEDPLGAGDDGFRECFEALDRCARGVVQAILSGDVPPARARSRPAAQEAMDRPGNPAGAPSGSRPEPPQDDTNAEETWFSTIAGRIASARGGVAGITSMEFHVLDGWWKSGVPLWLVLEAIDETLALWPPGEAPRTLLKHCETALARRLGEAAASPPVAAPGARATAAHERAGPDGSDAREIRRRAAAILRDALRGVAADHGGIRQALTSGLDELSRDTGGMELVEAALSEIRNDLVKAASSLMPPERLAALHSAAAARLQPVAATMSPAAYDQALTRLAGDGVLDAFTLPRLSLLDLLHPRQEPG